MDYVNIEQNFIEPLMGPPNSPDINPVDYAIWGALRQRVYCLQPKTIQDGGRKRLSSSVRSFIIFDTVLTYNILVLLLLSNVMKNLALVNNFIEKWLTFLDHHVYRWSVFTYLRTVNKEYG